jgi:glycosyltransferase involved in cell wall biosynthesis
VKARPRVGVGLHLLSYPRARAGGLGTYERMLAVHLPAAAAGRADVVFFGGRDGEQLPGGVATHRSALPLASRAVRIPYEQLALPLIGRRRGLDVFHFCDQAVSAVAPALRTVVTVHDLAMARLPETFGARRARYKTAMTRRAVQRASLVIADSVATKDDLVALLDADPATVRVVPLGVEPRFAAAGDAEAAEAARAFGLAQPYLLYVGRLEPRKNLPVLVDAYAEARRRHGVTAPLVLAGSSSWLDEDLPGRAAAAGVGGHVRVLGHVPEHLLPGLLHGALAVAYPSRYEGFGLPVLEAMAAGTPVVTSTVSSLPEVAGDATLLVDPDDTDGLAEALGRLEADEPGRGRLSAAGRARAATFTWERTAAETVAVYLEAAARP